MIRLETPQTTVPPGAGASPSAGSGELAANALSELGSGGATGQAGGSQPAADGASRDLFGTIADVWNFPLTEIDDQPLTPGTLTIGLVFFLLGLAVSKFLSKKLRDRLLGRFGEGLAAVFQTLLFYVLLLVFTVSALKVANIPLTAFTLLGGALALGIGFGSQNIINNFISGLILLIERPINVGDLIEVDSLLGRVEAIGARSTRVRTGAQIDIVIPNSTFLEQNVINWSLSSDRVRVCVKVGVAYGSDTEKVTELMNRAATESPKSHKTPTPFVAFTDFGDNALAFEVHFWITMRAAMDRHMAESDVRYRIDKLFRDDHISISFPQRDVHLDTLKPLEVRLAKD